MTWKNCHSFHFRFKDLSQKNYLNLPSVHTHRHMAGQCLDCYLVFRKGVTIIKTVSSRVCTVCLCDLDLVYAQRSACPMHNKHISSDVQYFPSKQETQKEWCWHTGMWLQISLASSKSQMWVIMDHWVSEYKHAIVSEVMDPLVCIIERLSRYFICSIT